MRGRGDCGAVAVPQTRQLKLSRVPYLSSRSGTAARSPGPSRMCPQRPCVTDGSLNSNSLRSIASRVRVFSWSGRRARHACARSGLHEAFRRESGCGVRAKAYARRRIPVAHMRRSRAHRVSEATVNARTQEAVQPDQISKNIVHISRACTACASRERSLPRASRERRPFCATAPSRCALRSRAFRAPFVLSSS